MKTLAVILAAGKGSRLNSDEPKSMYEIKGKPMIEHIVSSIESIGDIDTLVVVGHKKQYIIDYPAGRVRYVEQKELNGTGHALLVAEDCLDAYDDIFVFMGDSPFIDSSTILRMKEEHKKNNSDCTFLYSTFPFNLPYARLVFDAERKLEYLVEDSVANEKEREIKEFFTSQYLFKSSSICRNLNRLKKDKVTGEINLTDIINVFINQRMRLCPLYIDDYWRLMGINTPEDLLIVQRSI